MFSRVKVFLPALLVVALAGTARAETIFPVGYTYTYAASAGDTNWTSTITFTSSTTMTMTDWDSPNQGTFYLDIEIADNAFSINQGHGLQVYFQPLNVDEYWTFTADDGSQGTATVVNILDSFTVPAGTFSNVYQVKYLTKDEENRIHMDATMYWVPGVGLLQADDYMYPHHHQLTGYAPVPLPPGLVLFGTGLAGLAVWRRFRQG